MKRTDSLDDDELRPEYELDYSQATRGKYFKRLLKEGANVVVLEPESGHLASSPSQAQKRASTSTRPRRHRDR